LDADVVAALAPAPTNLAPAPTPPKQGVDPDIYNALKGTADTINDNLNKQGDFQGPDPDVVKALGPNTENIKAGWWAGMKSQMTDPQHGWISKTLNTFTAGEQFVARQAVNMLGSVGAMNPQDAKQLLTQQDVHAHDIVNYFYKQPSSMGSRIARFGAGLAADVVLDPLSYIGVGELTEGAKSLQVGGETISGLDKLSSAERAVVSASNNVEKVISATGALGDFAPEAGSVNVLQHNLEMVAQHANGEIGSKDLFDGLVNLAPGVKEEAETAYAKGLTPKGYFEQWATGDRGLTLGYHIPFTNIAKEIDAPMASYLTKPSGQLAQGIIGGAATLATPLLDSAPVKWLSNVANSVWTKTGYPVMDAMINKSIGMRNQFQDWAQDFSKESYASLKDADLSEVADHIEKTTYDPNLIAQGGKFETTAEDEARFNGFDTQTKDFTTNARKLNDSFIQDEISRPGLHAEALATGEPGDANAYLMHMMNPEWVESEKRTSNAVDYAFNEMQKAGLYVNESSSGRAYRGYISDANEISVGKNGIKQFVDDPVALTVERGKRSVTATTNYDLLDTMAQHSVILHDGDEIPEGYVKIKREHLGAFDAPTGQAVIGDGEEVKNSVSGYVWKRFVPPSIMENEGKMVVPEAIYNRVIGIVNQPQYGTFAQGLIDANQAFMRVFRNTALFGPGYLGMKMTSDMTTVLANGSFSNPLTAMVDATRALHGGLGGMFEFEDRAGNAYSLTQDQLYNQMLEHNVLRSNITRLAEVGDIAENIASTKEARDSLGQKASNFLDMVNLWRLNRGLTKAAEDIPKAAVFIDRLRGGFSPAGAAEASEKLFGNFSNENVGARVLNNIFPFTSVALKTIEGKLSQLRDGELAALSIPGKVQAALEGAFVPDKDVREQLSSTLPSYLTTGMDKIHGQLLPGQLEVMAEVPWVTNTLHFFGDPKQNMHPLLKLISAWATSKDEMEYNDITPKEEMAKSLGQTLGKFIPSYLKQALQVAEINGSINLGGVFSNSLAGQVGSSALGLDKVDQKVPYKNGAMVQQFQDATDFGKYIESHRDENKIYNMIFPNKIDTDGATGNDLLMLAERGKYIKEHFRDLTLGFATLTDMDKNVAINMGAMKRQQAKLINDVKENIAKQGYLVNSDAFQDESKMEQMAPSNPKIQKAMDIGDKMDALHQYYDWYSHVQKSYGANNPWGLLFSADKYQYSHDGKPEESWFKHQAPDEADHMKSILDDQEGEDK
jgi:hypothetical protein